MHYDKFLVNKRNIRNKFDALQEIPETPTTKDEYEDFVNPHIEVTAKCLPTKPRDPWDTLVVSKKACRRKNSFPMQKKNSFLRNPININV